MTVNRAAPSCARMCIDAHVHQLAAHLQKKWPIRLLELPNPTSLDCTHHPGAPVRQSSQGALMASGARPRSEGLDPTIGRRPGWSRQRQAALPEPAAVQGGPMHPPQPQAAQTPASRVDAYVLSRAAVSPCALSAWGLRSSAVVANSPRAARVDPPIQPQQFQGRCSTACELSPTRSLLVLLCVVGQESAGARRTAATAMGQLGEAPAAAGRLLACYPCRPPIHMLL